MCNIGGLSAPCLCGRCRRAWQYDLHEQDAKKRAVASECTVDVVHGDGHSAG